MTFETDSGPARFQSLLPSDTESYSSLARHRSAAQGRQPDGGAPKEPRHGRRHEEEAGEGDDAESGGGAETETRVKKFGI